MNQVRERVEEQVRRLSSEIGGDDRGTPGTAQRSAPGGESWDRHPVNLRLSIPLPFGRYYVTLVAGKERRDAERLASERRKHPLLTFGNVAVFFGLGCVCGLALLALFQLASAYLLTQLGIMVPPK
jgi:hypothetical protein